MFRPIVSSARCAARNVVRSQSVVPRQTSVSSFIQSQRLLPVLAVRGYAASGLSKPEVEGRIMDLLKGFDKIKDVSKLQSTSNFTNDLGLDSLDTVEVVMAIEEEFSIEMPDKEADAITSVDKAVEYILAQPDGKSSPLRDKMKANFRAAH